MWLNETAVVGMAGMSNYIAPFHVDVITHPSPKLNVDLANLFYQW